MVDTKILIVEDETIIANDIKSTLERFGYIVTGISSSGEDAIRMAQETCPDLVLMDIFIEGEISGIESAKRIYDNLDIPIIYLSAYMDDKILEQVKIAEPFGYILKPFDERELYTSIEIAIYKHKTEKALKESIAKQQRILEEIVKAITLTVQLRDPYTSGHEQKVSQLANSIATEMGIPKEQTQGILIAALLHDVGKIYVPAEILSKPNRLSRIEFEMIKTHPQLGYEILKEIEFPWPVAQMILQHHEKLDGSGYPSGLLGKDILLGARIIAVADVVEAMSSHRPYRPAHKIKVALNEISRKKGVCYDIDVVDACIRLFMEKRFDFEKAPTSLHKKK